MANLDLEKLYQQAFGPIATPRVLPDQRTKLREQNASSNLQVAEYDSPRMSLMGTPLFMPCNIDNYDLPNEPIIEINFSKNIVKTQIDGQKGTFKELFSMSDFTITIRGVVTQEDGSENYPEVEVRKIMDLCERKTDLKVVNDLCTIFGVPRLVIESGSFPAIDGAPSVQPYILNCLSDEEIDIELENG